MKRVYHPGSMNELCNVPGRHKDKKFRFFFFPPEGCTRNKLTDGPKWKRLILWEGNFGFHGVPTGNDLISQKHQDSFTGDHEYSSLHFFSEKCVFNQATKPYHHLYQELRHKNCVALKITTKGCVWLGRVTSSPKRLFTFFLYFRHFSCVQLCATP